VNSRAEEAVQTSHDPGAALVPTQVPAHVLPNTHLRTTPTPVRVTCTKDAQLPIPMATPAGIIYTVLASLQPVQPRLVLTVHMLVVGTSIKEGVVRYSQTLNPIPVAGICTPVAPLPSLAWRVLMLAGVICTLVRTACSLMIRIVQCTVGVGTMRGACHNRLVWTLTPALDHIMV